MRIAVASQGLDVAPRFTRCASFMCYRVVCGMIVDCQNMPNLSLPPAKLAQTLKDLGITVAIAGSFDPAVVAELKAADIEVESGATGSASGAARAYLASTLSGHDEELEAM